MQNINTNRRKQIQYVYVHLKTGYSRTTVSNIYHDRERIYYSALSKLCELFECNVGELLEHYNKE